MVNQVSSGGKPKRVTRLCVAAVLATLIALLLVSFAPAVAGTGDGEALEPGEPVEVPDVGDFVPHELLVRFNDFVPEKARVLVERGLGAAQEVVSENLDALRLLLPDSVDIQGAMTFLNNSGMVEYAEPNYVKRALWEPDDTFYQYQWNFDNPEGTDINVEPAWDINRGGSGDVVVAVLDTGVAYENYGQYTQADDLAETTFYKGYDFINSDSHPNDDQGHGTHVTGTIAQSTNNSHGVAGIAFNCSVMPVKILDAQGAGEDSVIAEGIEYAVDNGADIINMSLGGIAIAQVLRDAIEYAQDNGVLVVAATGNEGAGEVYYPAALPGVIAVGATDYRGELTYYSNYGTGLDIVAPGGDVSMDSNGDGYVDGIFQQTFSYLAAGGWGNPDYTDFAFVGLEGTSMACPHVAGAAALVKSQNPGWSGGRLAHALLSTARDLGPSGWDEHYGNGLLDVAAAMNASAPAVPSVTGVDTTCGAADTSENLTITGENFQAPLEVFLSREGERRITASSVQVQSSTQLTCSIDLTGAQPGLWSLGVDNMAGSGDVVEGGFQVDPYLSDTWYLAEGTTRTGFEEFILIQNPSLGDALVDITYMTPQGEQSKPTISIPAESRLTVNVNADVPNNDVSALVESDEGIICERSLYWNERVGGHDCIGLQAPSYTWYMAEGSTAWGFETYLLLMNPDYRDATVEITYMTSEGPQEREPLLVPAGTRQTVYVNEEAPSKDLSIKVESDRRILAERSMYWEGRREGHDSIGTPTPAESWYLAEGSTAWGYDQYVLIQNPNDEAVDVNVTYMTEGGPVDGAPMTIPARSRDTIHVNEILPDRNLSTMVFSDKGIIVERSMFWNNGTGRAGHDTIGAPHPRYEIALAEGTTDWGFQEYLLIQNPTSATAKVDVKYMTPEGPQYRDPVFVGANSRVTVNVNDEVYSNDVSVEVVGDVPIMAERAMYWHANGAGHCSIGFSGGR